MPLRCKTLIAYTAFILAGGAPLARDQSQFPQVTKSYHTGTVCYSYDESAPPRKPAKTSYCAGRKTGKLNEINTVLRTAAGEVRAHVHILDSGEPHQREKQTRYDRFMHFKRLSVAGQEYEREFFIVRTLGDNWEKAFGQKR